MIRRSVAATVAAITIFGTLASFLAAAPAAGAQEDLPRVRRVLVIALPGVTWKDVDTNDVPTLRRLLDHSAVASLAVRVGALKTPVNNGYATIGSGTRALARRADAGLSFAPRERVEGDTAGDAYRRQQGRAPTGVSVYLRLSGLKSQNKHSLYDATISVLGDALAQAHIERGVVANADTAPPLPDLSSYHREAALSLMDSHGQVPCGAVGTNLLARDPTAAFGVRLDPGRVEAAMTRCFRSRSVVLVEASDLPRTEQYANELSRPRFDAMWSSSLVKADRLVARLLTHVDPAHDAVVVVAPSSPQVGVPHLTVFGVRAPGLQPGFLDSGVTRQAGFVSIVDVAPTIAALAGAHVNQDDIEGRPVSVAEQGGSATHRVSVMVAADANARFRDRNITPFTLVLTIAVLVFSVGTLALLTFGRRSWLLEWVALALIAAFPMSYWAALLPFRDWGAYAFYIFVFGGAIAIGGAFLALRRREVVPLIGVLALMPLTTAISVILLGSRLQISTVFGDSPIVAGRFSGVNNVTYAQLMVAVILIAALIMATVRRELALWIIGVLFVAVLLLDGAPMWGADVGGMLAGIPALAIAFTLFAGWKVRVRTVITAVVVTLVVVVGLGLLDLTRPASQQTHLGRLFESIAGKGSSGFTTVVGRKLHVQLGTLRTSVWRFMFFPTLVFACYMVWRMPDRLRLLRDRYWTLPACLIAIAVAGVLGYALNDSGVAVPGAMLTVLAPAAIYLLMRVDGRVEERADERVDDVVAAA